MLNVGRVLAAAHLKAWFKEPLKSGPVERCSEERHGLFMQDSKFYQLLRTRAYIILRLSGQACELICDLSRTKAEMYIRGHENVSRKPIT
jgi:hypothetical protein